LVVIDPKNKSLYDQNFNEFSKKITDKMNIWKQEMAKVEKSEFVTYHKVWAYFFEAFELSDGGTLELFPGVPPTIKHLKHLKDNLVKQNQDVIILTANFYPKNIGESFSKDVNAKFRHISTNVGEDGISSYTDLFDYLVAEITK
jgi:ABC-type metal ion transport system, periplasmic component/surface adhesin